MSSTFFLLGNGFSIALSPDFALRNITKRFIEGIEGQDRAFLEAMADLHGSELGSLVDPNDRQ